jgi:hypothetical protein
MGTGHSASRHRLRRIERFVNRIGTRRSIIAKKQEP